MGEMERSVHDSLCAVSKALEFNACVPGGAAVETALNIYVEDFAKRLGSRCRQAQGAQVRDGSGDFDSSYRRPHQAPASSRGAALDSLKTPVSNHFYNLSTTTT